MAGKHHGPAAGERGRWCRGAGRAVTRRREVGEESERERVCFRRDMAMLQRAVVSVPSGRGGRRRREGLPIRLVWAAHGGGRGGRGGHGGRPASSESTRVLKHPSQTSQTSQTACTRIACTACLHRLHRLHRLSRGALDRTTEQPLSPPSCLPAPLVSAVAAHARASARTLHPRRRRRRPSTRPPMFAPLWS
jgi:hypothetical protein